jgi:type I restriction enzyme, S subunit
MTMQREAHAMQWFGTAPARWGVRKFNRSARLVTDKAQESEFKVALENIESWSGRFVGSVDQGLSGEGIAFRRGDILFGKLRPYLAKVWLADRDGAAVGDFHVYRSDVYDGHYLSYLLLNSSYVDLINGSTYGAQMPRASWGFVRDVAHPLPPLDEQRKIGEYLDRETSKIDELIAKQEQLIEALEERRVGVVAAVIAEGLDPSARMTRTSSSWFPQVPVGFRVGAVKHYTNRITDGAHISPDTQGGEYDFVSTRDVTLTGIDFAGSLKTTPETYEYMVRTGCQPKRGDVLFSKDGTIGRTVVVDEDREFVVASSLIIITPNSQRLDSYYLNYLYQSSNVQEQVRSFVKGAGLPRLSIANLLKVEGAIPPLPQQREIVRYLDRETEAIASLSGHAQRLAELLRERRAALISAAVTGKIDVRGL